MAGRSEERQPGLWVARHGWRQRAGRQRVKEAMRQMTMRNNPRML